jgi:hypothetical protein
MSNSNAGTSLLHKLVHKPLPLFFVGTALYAVLFLLITGVMVVVLLTTVDPSLYKTDPQQLEANYSMIYVGGYIAWSYMPVVISLLMVRLMAPFKRWWTYLVMLGLLPLAYSLAYVILIFLGLLLAGQLTGNVMLELSDGAMELAAILISLWVMCVVSVSAAIGTVITTQRIRHTAIR